MTNEINLELQLTEATDLLFRILDGDDPFAAQEEAREWLKDYCGDEETYKFKSLVANRLPEVLKQMAEEDRGKAGDRMEWRKGLIAIKTKL
jgi:hypothetical protein